MAREKRLPAPFPYPDSVDGLRKSVHLPCEVLEQLLTLALKWLEKRDARPAKEPYAQAAFFQDLWRQSSARDHKGLERLTKQMVQALQEREKPGLSRGLRPRFSALFALTAYYRLLAQLPRGKAKRRMSKEALTPTRHHRGYHQGSLLRLHRAETLTSGGVAAIRN